MMPRKKLEFYANKYGFEYSVSIKMTDEELSAVCEAVGSKQFGMPDCGGRLSTLIDCVMEDPQFRKAVTDRISEKGTAISEDFLAMRMADYAADAVMKAYSEVRGKA